LICGRHWRYRGGDICGRDRVLTVQTKIFQFKDGAFFEMYVFECDRVFGASSEKPSFCLCEFSDGIDFSFICRVFTIQDCVGVLSG
jgi:hypothetical protein